MISSFSGNYRFLSNFFPCEIAYEEITYPSLEHAYQAAKTLDIEERKKMAGLPRPVQAKRAGRELKLREDWEERKVPIMLELLRIKFAPGSHLAELMQMTGIQELVEGNNWRDKFWGVCDGEGQNVLGRLLMQVRYENRMEIEHESEEKDG